MKGKQKCAILKQIRRDIARSNQIDITIVDCKHQGECSGTCPRCESEVRALEEELRQRCAAGLRTVIAGASAGILATNMVACDPTDLFQRTEVDRDMMPPITDAPTPETESSPDTLTFGVLPTTEDITEPSSETETGLPDSIVIAGELPPEVVETLMGDIVLPKPENTDGL